MYLITGVVRNSWQGVLECGREGRFGGQPDCGGTLRGLCGAGPSHRGSGGAASALKSGKLGAASRAGKRQAAPFSKGPPKAEPKPPGRKAGGGLRHPLPPRRARRGSTRSYEAALPACCTDPDCPGRVKRTGVAEQYQTEVIRRSVSRRFDVAVGECDACGRRVQGRHPLQTSDALGCRGQPDRPRRAGAGGAA